MVKPIKIIHNSLLLFLFAGLLTQNGMLLILLSISHVAQEIKQAKPENKIVIIK